MPWNRYRKPQARSLSLWQPEKAGANGSGIVSSGTMSPLSPSRIPKPDEQLELWSLERNSTSGLECYRARLATEVLWGSS